MIDLHSLRLCTDYLSKVLPICRVDIPAHIIPHNSRPMDHPQIYFAMFVWYVDLLAVSLNMHLAFCLDPFLSHTHTRYLVSYKTKYCTPCNLLYWLYPI